MSLSIEQLAERYQHSGLTSALPPFPALLAQYGKQHAQKSPADAATLLRWLVKQNVLTRYQAQTLAREDEPQLALGGYVLRGPVESPPLNGWWNAWNDQRQSVLVKPLSGPPSADLLQRLSRYRALDAANLLPFAAPTPTSDGLLLVTSLPKGRPASTLAGKVPADTCARWAADLLEAVEKLHAHDLLAHADHLDRLWVTGDEQIVLLWDPTQSPDEPHSNLFPANPPHAGYRAPETLLEQTIPNVQTDLFAIGALLYELRRGRPPYAVPTDAADQPEQLRSIYADVPQSLQTAIRSGADGDPLDRILAHLLAQQPTARFAQAADTRAAVEKIAPPRQPVASKRPVTSNQPEAKQAKAQPATTPKSTPRPIKPEPQPAVSKTVDPSKQTTVKPAASNKPAAAEKAKPASKATPVGKAKPAEKPKPEPKTPSPKPTAPAPAAAEATPAESTPAKPEPIKPAANKPAPTKPAAAETAPAQPAAPAIQENAKTPDSTAPDSDAPVIVETTPATTPTTKSERPEASSGKPSSTSSATRRPTSARRKKKKKKNPVPTYILGGLGFVVISLIVAILVRPGGKSNQQQAERRTQLDPSLIRPTPGSTTPKPATSTTDTENGMQLVDDDRLLWAPPGPASAASLTLLPPGPDMLVTFRPDALLEAPAGRAVVAALSPELQSGLDAIASRVALPWERIERVTVALRGGVQGMPQTSLAVDLREPLDKETLADLWQAEEAQAGQGTVVFMRDDPDAELFLVETNDQQQITRYAVTDMDTVKEIAEMQGGPIPLPRQWNELWTNLSDDAAVTVLGGPNYLFADGRAMLERYAAQWSDPLQRFLIPDVSVFAVRMDFTPDWYVELQFTPGGGSSPGSLRDRFDQVTQDLPGWAENFLIDASPHPSWKPLAIRLPAMMRALQAQTRSGTQDGRVLANAYLPQRAAPNVLLASWLASNTPAGTGAMPTTTAQPSSGALTSMDDLLKHRFSISFGQESLEMAGEAICDQFNSELPAGSTPLQIVLLGGDLQLDGITQNQQIRDFNHSEAPLQTVLDDLVQRANPDRTVTALSQPTQALVWVVGKSPDNPDQEVILITTRSQAAKKNYTLPAQFQSN